MKAVTYDYAASHMDEIFKMAEFRDDGVIIVRNNKNFVLMDRDFLESIIETAELLRDRDLVSSLKKSKQEIIQGESYSFEDVFGEEI